MNPTERDAARFMAKVDICSEPHPRLGTPCWRWVGARNGARPRRVASGGSLGGYGSFWIQGRAERAHVVSFVIAFGRVPDGPILHACDNPACVSPLHVAEGTLGQNLRDAHARGRRKSTEARTNSTR